MKKITLCTILALCFIMMSGCKRKDIVITTEDVAVNTVLIKHDGTVQAATVEEFSKDYYDMNELSNFITKEMKKYNTNTGEESITFNTLEQKGNSAVLILNYMNIDHYSNFNEIDLTLTSAASAKKGDITLPDVFMSAADGGYVSKEAALKNDKYKVLVMNEDTDVIIDGKIKYFANGVLVSDTKLQTAENGQTVIIYKP